MPPKPSAKRPHSSPHIREDAITTPIHAQSESHTRFRPIEHVREQGPSTEARFRRQPHQKYTGFHPKAAKPNNKRTPSEDKLATALSEQLQANIQDAANEFSAQIVHSANELANNAADAVGADIQSAAGAISDAVANTSANIEANIKDTVARLGTDFEGQVAQYLTPKNIERAAVRIVHHLAHVAIGAQHLIMSSEHPNDQDERDDEEDPLLPARKNMRASRNFVNVEHWNDRNLKTHAIHTTRDKVKHFLSSKVGHYSVLTLVALDVAGIVAGKLSLHTSAHLFSALPRLTNTSLHNLPLQMRKALGKQRMERSPRSPRHRFPRLLLPLHARTPPCNLGIRSLLL